MTGNTWLTAPAVLANRKPVQICSEVSSSWVVMNLVCMILRTFVVFL